MSRSLTDTARFKLRSSIRLTMGDHFTATCSLLRAERESEYVAPGRASFAALLSTGKLACVAFVKEDLSGGFMACTLRAPAALEGRFCTVEDAATGEMVPLCLDSISALRVGRTAVYAHSFQEAA